MIAFFRTILGLIVTLPVAVFCGLNIQSVEVTYSPFHDPVSVPLYAVVLGFAFFDVLFGSFSTWLNTAPLRKERRQYKKQVRSMKKKLGDLPKQAENKEKALPVEVAKEDAAPAPTSAQGDE